MTQDTTSLTPYQTIAEAALWVLIILQTGMLFAMFTLTVPHPPLRVDPFAMGPFLSASLAIAFASVYLRRNGIKAWHYLGLLAALCALVSYGPQKWTDAAIGDIWPAIITAQVAIIALIYAIVQSLLKKR